MSDAIARAHDLLACAAEKNALRARGVEARKNGLGALEDVRAAFALAPDEPRVLVTWARIVLGMTRLSWAKRTLAKTFVRLDAAAEARALLPRLASLSQDATATLLRRALAAFADDARVEREATAALAALPQQDVTAAERKLTQDAQTAE